MQPSTREREIMEHALGFQRDSSGKRYRRGDRNSFVTGPDTDDWAPIQRLVELGMMQLRMAPSDDRGGMSVFAVTRKGFEALHPGEGKAGRRAQ